VFWWGWEVINIAFVQTESEGNLGWLEELETIDQLSIRTKQMTTSEHERSKIFRS